MQKFRSSRFKLVIPIVAAFSIMIATGIFFYLRSQSSGTSEPSEEYVAYCSVGNACDRSGYRYLDASLPVEVRVDDLLNRMTVAEKIGQMALIEKNSISDQDDIAKYGLGALMSGGGGKPEENTPEGWRRMIDAFQGISQKTRLGIPLLYGVDANHGHGNVPGATIFPHAIGLGASGDADLVKSIASATAEEALATGVNWGSSINKNFRLDQGDTVMDEKELRRSQIEPFKSAIRADVKTVMAGLNRWNGAKVTFNKYLLTDVLKKELGFRGFVVSDWYGVYENEQDEYEAMVKAINAGVDMVMLPFDYRSFSRNMQTALANGDVDMSRVDDAVRRILTVKFELGIFDKPTVDSVAIENIGNEANRELARRAVRQSLVLLKNNRVLPISEATGRILVSGSAADNIGKQSGGWTVEWQGIDGNWIPGKSILKGIRDTVSIDTEVEYDLKGNFDAKKGLADVGIAIVGENPYAEGWGDDIAPKLSKQDLESIEKLKKASKKIVVVIVSGRPLDIQAYAKDWDGIVAAWLPGSEGQGVADVIFGDSDFSGKLPGEWMF